MKRADIEIEIASFCRLNSPVLIHYNIFERHSQCRLMKSYEQLPSCRLSKRLHSSLSGFTCKHTQSIVIL